MQKQAPPVRVGGLARACCQLRGPRWHMYFLVLGSLFASYKTVQGLDDAMEQWALKVAGFD